MQFDTVFTDFKTKLARLASIAFHPFLVVPLAIILILYFETHSLPAALGWSLLVAALVILPSLLYLGYKLRKNDYSDFDISIREERHSYYLFGIAATLLGWSILAVMRAPRPLMVLFATCLTGIVTMGLITHYWLKVSIHVAVNAATAVSLAFYSLPLAGLWGAVTVLVGWSRVKLGRHTLREVVAGAGISAMIILLVAGLIATLQS
jgi:membrane-associated phospholipid phosphatase